MPAPPSLKPPITMLFVNFIPHVVPLVTAAMVKGMLPLPRSLPLEGV